MKKKITGFIIACVVVLVGLFSIPFVFEKVDAGQYKIVQQLDGDIIVLDRAGWQYTGFVSNITTYNEAGIFYFSSSDLDGGKGLESQPVEVRFGDGVQGWVNGNVQFKMPADKDTRITLHKLYGRNYDSVVHNLVVKSVTEAITRSAPHFKGEEAYSYRGADFINLVQRQIKEGIFATYTEQKIIKDVEDNEFIENFVRIKKDKDGNIVISKESKIARFDVDIIGLNIEKVRLDDNAMKYIEAKKTAEFEKIQKRAEAEASKQDKITAEEKGKADVARAKAKADIVKQKAVTEAEQRKEVAELNAKQELNVAISNRKKSQEQAKSMIAIKEAEAKVNALLKKSGLTPEQEMDMKITMNRDKWENIARANLTPQYMMGGSSKGGSTDAFIGIKTIEALKGLDNK